MTINDFTSDLAQWNAILTREYATELKQGYTFGTNATSQDVDNYSSRYRAQGLDVHVLPRAFDRLGRLIPDYNAIFVKKIVE